MTPAGRRGARRRRTAEALVAALPVVAGLAVPAGLGAQHWRSVTAARQVTNEADLRVTVKYGAGVLTIRRGERGELYNAFFHFDEERVVPETEYARGLLKVGLSALEAVNPGFGDWSDESALDLELAPGVALDLDVHFGAGRAELDLTGLALRSLEVNTGASESVIRVDEVNAEEMSSAAIGAGAADLKVYGVGNLNAGRVAVKSGLGSVTLRLDGEWPRDGHLVVEMGLGALKLQVPRWLGVRLTRPGGFLASIETVGLEKRGKVRESANWETAERRLEIEITAVLGDVDLEWIR